MFIPLTCDSIICLADVVALYRDGGKTVILHSDGRKSMAGLTPLTLKKRQERLWNESVNNRRYRVNG